MISNRILDIYFLNDRINFRRNANDETRFLVIIVMWTLDWSPSMKLDNAVELDVSKVGYDFYSILKMFTTLVAMSLSHVSACDRLGL